MTSQSTGIQQLLAAEKKAAEKVTEARKRKYRRIYSPKNNFGYLAAYISGCSY